jgi:hypothetical protein
VTIKASLDIIGSGLVGLLLNQHLDDLPEQVVNALQGRTSVADRLPLHDTDIEFQTSQEEKDLAGLVAEAGWRSALTRIQPSNMPCVW